MAWEMKYIVPTTQTTVLIAWTSEAHRFVKYNARQDCVGKVTHNADAKYLVFYFSPVYISATFDISLVVSSSWKL